MITHCELLKIEPDYRLLLYIISQNEIKLVLGLGVAPERIIYSNPNKQISHLKYAASKEVSMMAFDGEEEVYKIKEYYPKAEYVTSHS